MMGAQLHVALALIAAIVIGVGLFAKRLKASPLQEPLVGMLCGIAVGPFGLGWLEPQPWATPALLEDIARLTLAIGLMATAQRITAGALRRLWRPVALLLTAGMLGMWTAAWISAGWALGLPFWAAAALAAALTPTDPVVASSIVTGDLAERHLPARLRSMISLESGANDGLAYLFVLLPILMLDPGTTGAWAQWALESIARGVLLGAAGGALIGYAAGRGLDWSEHREFVGGRSVLTFTVALPILTLGVMSLARSDALIAVFVAGVIFNLTSHTQREQRVEHTQEAVAMLFALPMFFVFGAVLPIGEWARMGWPLAVFAAAVLLFRRLPVLALLHPAMRGALRVRDSAYLAWFGPIGVAAIYYAAYATRRTGDEAVWAAASAAIFASVVAHGATAAPLTRLYSRRKPKNGRNPGRQD